MVRTGKHTGRAANDKFFVKEPSSEKLINWGQVNQPMSEASFDRLHMKAVAYLQNRSVYVSDVRAGSDKKYSLPMRVVTETAWHSLFVRNMFIRPSDEELKTHEPQFTIIHCPVGYAWHLPGKICPHPRWMGMEPLIVVSVWVDMICVGSFCQSRDGWHQLFDVYCHSYGTTYRHYRWNPLRW